MEINAYVLLDAAEQHRRTPETFDYPGRDEIASLKAGDMVKVCAQFDPEMKLGDTVPKARLRWAAIVGDETADRMTGERFWVKIASARVLKTGEFAFNGVVDNDLVYKAHHGLDYRQEIAFEGRHILQCLPA